MSLRSLRWGLILLLAGAGLALTQSRVQAQDLVDNYETLDNDLYAELDDIWTEYDNNGDGVADYNQRGVYDLGTLHQLIMYALSDEGDENDPKEAENTYQELENEMTQAGTSLTNEVWLALLEADEVSFLGGSPSWDSPALGFANVGFSAGVVCPVNTKYNCAASAGTSVNKAIQRIGAKARSR